MSYAFAAAATIAVVWWSEKKLSFVWRRRQFESAVGSDPTRPVPVVGYKEPRKWVRQTPCYCGGKLWDVGEGPAAMSDRYRVTTECATCGQNHVFFFDVSQIPN